MPADVETTRHIVQCHWTDTRNENSFKRALELFENISIEPLGMRHRPIYFLALLIEHSIGEVVVFIDDKIKGILLDFCLTLYQS